MVLNVDDVDKTFQDLSERGVSFINKPTDMTGWGIRTAHFRDPENNLIEICSDIAKEKWDEDLQEESDKYEL
ncbi:MAG: VOC family protein [Bacteroidales bacterium]|nr:VOC family protein [Bacteroidales bacterium]